MAVLENGIDFFYFIVLLDLGFRSFFRAIWDLFQVATARPIGSSAESESSFTRAVMNDKL